MNHSLLHQRRQDLVKRMLLLQHCLNGHHVDALVGTPVCSIPWVPETFRGFRFTCFSQVFLVTLMAWACSLHQWQRIPVHGRKTPGTQSNSMAYVMLNNLAYFPTSPIIGLVGKYAFSYLSSLADLILIFK